MAWHIAALSRVDAKKFPKHDKLMQKAAGPRKRQTQEQQMTMARLFSEMRGGMVVGKSEG